MGDELLDDETVYYTTSSTNTPAPTITLEILEKIVRNFTDRMPALLVAIKVHPDFFDVFMANLREYGVQKRPNPDLPFALEGVPIFKDRDVPYGKIEKVFAGDRPKE